MQARSVPSEFGAAVAFLTPFGNRRGPQPGPTTMAYFPAVGAAIGAVIGLSWAATRRRLPPLPAAAIVVGLDALVTGGLHLDGLADTADGLCAHVPAKSRLEIMSEPQVGTFAVVALGAALITRTAALAALEPSPALLACLYCSSRSVMVVASRTMTYARQEGLATAFLPAPAGSDGALVAGVAGAGAALLLAALVAGRRGARAVVAGWLSGALVLVLAQRRIGGFTGDVLGAAGVVCETSGLVVAAAK